MKVERHKMSYKIDNNDSKNKIRILGYDFVKNNSNKGKIIINNKKSMMKEYIIIDNIKDNKIKVKIILNKYIYNKSFMFKDCISLITFSNYDSVDYSETNLDFEFVKEDNENLIDFKLYDD